VLTVNLSIAAVLEQRQSASLHALWPSLLREALVSLPSVYSMLLLCCICLQDGVSLHHGSAVDTVGPWCCVCACLSNTIIGAISTSLLRSSESTATSNMADDLATDISKTKQKIEKLERHIDTIRTGDETAIKALGYGSRAAADAALNDLTADKRDSYDLLKTYETRLTALTQQQQQSGAGTSMLRVRLALVIFLPQRSCCMLANLVACRVCLVACNPAQLRPASVKHL
jgi:hypothetical protein